jgi:hypothetical protein
VTRRKIGNKVTNDWDMGMREAGKRKEKEKLREEYRIFSTGKTGEGGRGRAESGGLGIRAGYN